MFEIQKSGDKTSSGEIGLDIRTDESPKVGQDQASGGVSVHLSNDYAIPFGFSMFRNFWVITF